MNGNTPVGAQPKKAEGSLIDKLVEMVRPDELSSPKETASAPIDNTDDSGWGIKKIEHVETPAGKTGQPKGILQAPEKYMSKWGSNHR